MHFWLQFYYLSVLLFNVKLLEEVFFTLRVRKDDQSICGWALRCHYHQSSIVQRLGLME